MGKKFNFFVACDEANHVCDKSQYKEATLLEKIKLNLHLIYCRACREYSSNNGKLTKMIKKSQVDCLKDEEKLALKNKFEKAMNHIDN